MEVDVQIQRRAEPLDEGNCARASRLLRKAGLPDQVASDDAVDDAEHPADQCRMRGQQKPQRKRQTQHPLANRPLRQHMIAKSDTQAIESIS